MAKQVALVTGCTGQDGALLSELLLGKDYQVVGVTRRTSGPTDWRLKELKLYSHPNFHVVSGDITDQGSLDRIVQQFEPAEIYNLAAQSFVGASWDQPETTMDITGLGALKVFEAARKFSPDSKIYQASSSEMFGGAKRVECLNENSIFQPRSPYGVAKCMAHHMAKVYRESYGIFISCGILFNHESEYRGLEFVTRKITDGIARIKLGLQNHIELGNLDAVRDWGYARDFVIGMWQMLQQDQPDDFILATAQARSIGEFVKETLMAAKIDPDEMPRYVKQNPRFVRPADVGHLLGDYSKAKEKFDWAPWISFPRMVEKMLKKDLERISNEH
jgi:GDPmannose 4,6-dehydratase